MRIGLSFILPTLNRKQFVKRAIASCLACESDLIEPHVIVIDSESSDGTFEELQFLYGNDPRVVVVRNKRTDGFMASCFHGVELSKTEFVNFMYDDDVLSPYFKGMVSRMIGDGRAFIMGYGKMHDVRSVYPFEPISGFKYCDKIALLTGYFGYSKDFEFEGQTLPVSPICCVTKRDLLKLWIECVKEFTKNDPLREYFMMYRNSGPDLMIYLLSILKSSNDVCVTPSIVAQFSEHPDAMSISHKNDMFVGYWLARVWAWYYLNESRRIGEAKICACYVIMAGCKLILNRLRFFKFKWSWSIFKEVSLVFFKVACSGYLFGTLVSGYSMARKRSLKITLERRIV